MQQLSVDDFVKLIKSAAAEANLTLPENIEMSVAADRRSAYVDIFGEKLCGRITFSLDGYCDVEVLNDDANTLRWEHFDRDISADLVRAKFEDIKRDMFGA